MKDFHICHDEGARRRLESLERFVNRLAFPEHLYYCATHNAHYTEKDFPYGGSPTVYCPRERGEGGDCAVSVV